jgi:hypothetical protein
MRLTQQSKLPLLLQLLVLLWACQPPLCSVSAASQGGLLWQKQKWCSCWWNCTALQ